MPRSNRVQPAPLADRKRKVRATQGNRFSSAPTTTLATRPLSTRAFATASTSATPAAAAAPSAAAAPAGTTTSATRPRATRAPPISRPSAVADTRAPVGVADLLTRVDDVAALRRGGCRAVLLVPLVAAAALRDEVVRAVLPRVVGVVLVESWWGRGRGCRLLLVVVVLAVFAVVCRRMSDFLG